jgi:SAM-dependent methyltransferase
MRDFDLGRAFDLIYAAYGTFHHLLTDGEQRDCLACVQAHLAPGGCFAFDLRPWSFADWEEAETAVLFHDWTRALPGGETVLKLRSALPDAERRLQRETHIYDVISPSGEVRRLVVPVDLRFSSRYEIERLLQEAGLALDQVYGDFDLGPFDELSSDYLITVASRPEDREQP